MQPKFCSNCGQPLVPGSRFCGDCGQTTETVTTDASKEPLLTNPETVKTITPGGGRTTQWRWLILFVMVAILAGLAFAAYENNFFGLWPPKQNILQEKVPEALSKDTAGSMHRKTPPGFNLSSVSRYVKAVRFFESGFGAIDPSQRFYRTDFSAFDTRYVNWELNLNFPPPPQRVDFIIEAVWHRPDGSIHFREAINVYLEAGWRNSWHVSGLGNEMPGTWIPGQYNIEFFVAGKRIARGMFNIY
jgi:hypothetical protein